MISELEAHYLDSEQQYTCTLHLPPPNPREPIPALHIQSTRPISLTINMASMSMLVVGCICPGAGEAARALRGQPGVPFCLRRRPAFKPLVPLERLAGR